MSWIRLNDAFDYFAWLRHETPVYIGHFIQLNYLNFKLTKWG